MKSVLPPSFHAQSMKSAPIKNSVEPASQSVVSVGGIDSGSRLNAFQIALSKQVESKRTLSSNLATKPHYSNNIGVKLASPQKHAVNVDDVPQAVLDENLLQIEGLFNKDLMPKEVLVIGKDATEVDSSSFISPEVNADITSVPIIAPIILASVNNKNVQEEMSEGGLIVNQNYDAALSKVLTLNNSMGVLEGDTINIKSTSMGVLEDDIVNIQSTNMGVLEDDIVNIQNSDNNLSRRGVSEHTKWLDAMLPAASKQSIATNEYDAAEGKVELAIKGGIESGFKEAMPPVGFQSTFKVNITEHMQQLGSTNAIVSYPGKAGWDQAISQKVVWMVGAGEQSATLTLNPPDLGPLQVVIHVHNDLADATFISDNAEVRQALESGMSNLRDKMSESGVQLGQASVTAGNQSQQEFQRATQNRLAARTNDANVLTPLLNVDGTQGLVRKSNGLVDTFA